MGCIVPKGRGMKHITRVLEHILPMLREGQRCHWLQEQEHQPDNNSLQVKDRSPIFPQDVEADMACIIVVAVQVQVHVSCRLACTVTRYTHRSFVWNVLRHVCA